MTQDNDPWGNNPRNTDSNELASVLSKLKDRLFGGGGNQPDNNHASGGKNSLPTVPKKAILPILVVAALGYGASGVYILQEGFHGVELTFGKYSETAIQPGFNFRWPTPIGSVDTVDIGSLKNLTVGSSENNEGQMLTSDENIVEVSLSVQYKIGNAEKYLFNVNEPETVLRETLISSIREVVGSSNVDYVLTDGRAEWPAKVQENLISTLNGFNVGLDILRVKLSKAKAPREVQEAFDDAVKAREDAARYQLQAEAYQNKEIPLARGEAKRITEQAEAYKAEVVAKATGEATRFDEVLKTYQLAPQVTRDRMYIETLQNVYSNVNNIVVATGENTPIMYLPMGQNGQGSAPPLPAPTPNVNNIPYRSQPLETPVVKPETQSNKRLSR